jgi:hypothetical protein
MLGPKKRRQKRGAGMMKLLRKVGRILLFVVTAHVGFSAEAAFVQFGRALGGKGQYGRRSEGIA